MVRSIPQKRIPERIEEQTVDVRMVKGIPQERISERIKEQTIDDSGLLNIPQERISERILRQKTLDVPIPCMPAPARGGNSSSAAAPLKSAEWLGNRVFALFPRKKKCDDSARVECATGRALQLMDTGGL